MDNHLASILSPEEIESLAVVSQRTGRDFDELVHMAIATLIRQYEHHEEGSEDYLESYGMWWEDPKEQIKAMKGQNKIEPHDFSGFAV